MIEWSGSILIWSWRGFASLLGVIFSIIVLVVHFSQFCSMDNQMVRLVLRMGWEKVILSPHISFFILGRERLSRMFKYSEQRQLISGLKLTPKGLLLFHICSLLMIFFYFVRYMSNKFSIWNSWLPSFNWLLVNLLIIRNQLVYCQLLCIISVEECWERCFIWNG